ncbi:hypothetical protein [Erythrobacter sp. QSSC1-22B]|uniref:hypothetical protein n=1 Tax=Erythrobacter sp. QSSC1-22B TaxID=1860125 RepID=UPI001439DBEE|nr:hypothetical protein [Erythrobacter sp. QSSC1-22B]
MNAPVWHSTVTKDDLLEAIGFVRTKAGLRVQGIKLEPDVLIMACTEGLSFCTANMACDIPSNGSWPSPIRVNGAMLRRLAPKLLGPDIVLHYENKRLMINAMEISASEV